MSPLLISWLCPGAELCETSGVAGGSQHPSVPDANATDMGKEEWGEGVWARRARLPSLWSCGVAGRLHHQSPAALHT